VPSALGLPMGPSSARPRIALMVVLLAAAMPVRISGSFPVINSVSVLDVLLLVFGLTLLLDLASRPLDTGYRDLFSLLCIPLVVAIASIAWSDDRSATLRAVLIYAEGIIAYLFVVRELSDLPPARVITYIKRYSYLLIAPGVLLLLHAPGFAPQEAGLSHSSGTYLSYYSRLSHPILGRSNNLASLLAFFAPLLFYWGHRRRDRGVAIAAFITLVAIFLTLSRGVLLAFLIAGLLYAPLALGRRRIPGGGIAAKLAATVALAGIAIAVLYTVNPATHEFFAGRLTLANVHGRTALISASLDEIARRPLLGYGGGVDPLLEAAHNTYLQQAVYFGLPLGLVVSLSLCALVGVFLVRRGSSTVAGVIAYTLMVQLVIFLFESSFEGTVLRVLFYLSVGLATGFMRAFEAERLPATAPPV
jgi:O-antigen ligase